MNNMDILPPEKNSLEVSWVLNNAKHGDDQVYIDELPNVPNVSLFILADGVSDSLVGRFASALLVHQIQATIHEYLHSPNMTLAKLDQATLRYLVRDAVNRFVKEAEAIRKSELEYGEIIAKRSKILIQIGQCIQCIQALVDYQIQVKQWFQKSQNSQPLVNENQADLSTCQEFFRENKEEIAKTELHDALSVRLREVLNVLPLGKDETPTKVINDIRKRLITSDPQLWDGKTTLLVAVLITDSSGDDARFMTYCLGDSIIKILRNQSTALDLAWFSVYEPEARPSLTSWISSKDGIHGKPSVSEHCVYQGDNIIIASDGALINWTTVSGVSGIPFKNELTSCIKKTNSVKGFANNWIQYVVHSTAKALNDDASLIVVRITNKS